MRYVLLPGRHHLLTRFQATALRDLVEGRAVDRDGDAIAVDDPLTVVWAVTSANHAGTRRNPVAAHRREAAIERFSADEGLRSLVVWVFDTAPTDRFADVTLANVEAATGLVLTPADTVVACSTPQVIALYAELGFRIAPFELDHPDAPERPWDVLERLVAGDRTWRGLAAPATVDLYDRYGLESYIRTVCNDPIIDDEGGLTDTRDYRTYMRSFEAAADRKWALVGPHVVPGRVVDVGCATGGLLELAARDPRLHESDLYGIEIARHLYEECVHKKAQGVFANPNTFFLQRNVLAGPVFRDRSVDTTITMALTHEVFSYGDGERSVRALADVLFSQTAPGGVWINSDVCGPDDPDRAVVLHLRRDDGVDADEARDLDGLSTVEVNAHVASLSTRARFLQFAQDFRHYAGVAFAYQDRPDGSFACTLADAMEFLSKKDYADNWQSECHERFCGLDTAGWFALVEAAGFLVDPASRGIRNDWLVEHRFAPVARLEAPDGTPLGWPVTHVLLVARRPLNT